MNDPEITKLIAAMAVTNTKQDVLTKSTDELVTEMRQQRIDHAKDMKDLEHRVDNKLDKKADQSAVSKLQGHLDWFVKIIIGAVLMAILGLVIINAKPIEKPLVEKPAASSTKL